VVYAGQFVTAPSTSGQDYVLSFKVILVPIEFKDHRDLTLNACCF
jgi:hypothetical protein